MHANAQWPASDSERRDRDLVVELVRITGEQQLVWTVYDVRRLMKSTPRLRLTHTGQLSRHIHALDRELITPVDKRLDSGRARDESLPSRTRHQFVLSRRLPEYEAGASSMDDLERVYHALWVALEALGLEEVPTQEVTRVLHNIEALALVTPRNTLNHLVTLHERNQQLVEKSKRGRWSVWRALGCRPEHPQFEAWVQEYAATAESGSTTAQAGHATLNAMGHELVLRALRSSRSSTWPAGHSVQIADIRAAIGRDRRAKELSDHLRVRGRSVGAVLGDLTKERIAGRRRVERPVVKVGSVEGSAPYYDAPGEPGFERRRLILPFRLLQAELASNTLKQLDEEACAADRFRNGHGSVLLRAVGAVRLVLVHRALHPAERLLEELEDQSHLLSKNIRQGVDEYRSKLSAFLSRVPSREAVTDEAAQLFAELGEELEATLAADRPLMTPHAYVSYLSPHVVGDLTPSEFLHRVKTLRRFDNPNHTKQTDPDPARSARYCVDRAEGLCYLAERYQGRVYGFLRSGLQLLGRDHRSPVLFRRLARDGDPVNRRAALAALVLLDDPGARSVANEWLLSSERPEEIVEAIQALLVLGEIERTDWPPRIRRTENRQIRDALTNCVLAARSGRPLLQR